MNFNHQCLHKNTKYMKNKSLLIVTILAIALVSTACVKKPGNSDQNKTSDVFTKTLAAQSQIKKFSNAKELTDFFASRPPVSEGRGSSPTLNASDMMAVKESSPQASPAAPSGMGFGGDNQGEVFSTTNIQVQGVDESDIVKTDGEFIYTVKDQSIMIIKAKPAGEMKIISEIALKGTPQELYIKENKLVVFGYSNGAYAKMAGSMAPFRPFSSSTFFAVYDITDRVKPTMLKQLEFEGNYTSSRLIDNRLYFITANYNYYPFEDSPLPRVLENNNVISDSKTTEKYIYPTVYYIDTPSSLNATTVTVFNLDSIDAPLNSQVFLMPSGETVYASPQALYLAYTKYLSEYLLRMTVAREILGPRLSDRERQRVEAIAATDPFILSDDEKLQKINQIIELYISRLSVEQQKNLSKEIEDEFNRRHPDIANELEKTVVHKIAFSGDSLTYVGSGEVTGHLLNQYSLDEYNGKLRLATTRGQSWITPFLPMMQGVGVMEDQAVSNISAPIRADSSNSINNVYVLDESLKTIGKIESLAPGERIYSARFMGGRAYLVTFKQTDPLFVIDLSNPEKPVVLGQIKIPGFSNYLHPYDENTLIGLGKDVIDKGDQGIEVLGLKLSLFDVTEPTEPKELSAITLGGRGSDTAALYDYKAFLFDKEKNLLVIPAALTATGNIDYRQDFQGSVIFNVTAKSIKESGRVTFRLVNEMSSQNNYIDDTVRRNIFIGDTLYSLSPATIKASQLTSLALIKSLDIPTQVEPENLVPPSLPYEKPQSAPAPTPLR